MEWTDDCGGKKDYDGSIVRVSTRYWPAGGGFFVLDAEGFRQGLAGIKPSARSSILVGDDEVASREFEDDDGGKVMSQVESWVAEKMAIISKAVRDALKEGA